RWAKIPNVVWQLGLRGIADRPVWASDPAVPKSAEARGELISDAIALQWEIVQSVDTRPNPPATCTLWMEGAELHRQGHLTFPKGVTIVFSDNSPGWTFQADFRDVVRQPARTYGVYYHHQLWGSGPHLVQAVAPWRTHAVLGQAVKRGSTHYAMLNVGNVREFVLGLDASAKMLWDFDHFAPDRFFRSWCAKRFGKSADAVRDGYRGLFASFVDTENGSRAMLDGQIIQKRQGFYPQLLAHVRSGAKAPWKDPERIRALLAKVQRQRAAVELAGEGADDALYELKETERPLFEANFLAQQRILLGLLRWLESGLEAGLALQDGDALRLRQHADAAVRAIELIRSGQALASRGATWEHWYRGDRKMNITAAETLARQLLELTRPKEATE
ncbi:glycosyl hydrolase 115 family protein, partial [bacterium]|nr:glycosyl hydrolase 115 family protein [bacterium]